MALAPRCAQPHVGDVHRAALAGAIAIGLAGDLAHHAVGIGTAGDEDAVAAMVGGEAVALFHRLADAGYGFLADRHVQHGARRLAAHEEFVDPLLEGADAPHGAIEIEKKLVAAGCHAQSSSCCRPDLCNIRCGLSSAFLQTRHDVRGSRSDRQVGAAALGDHFLDVGKVVGGDPVGGIGHVETMIEPALDQAAFQFLERAH